MTSSPSLLKLVRGADSVELKLTVADPGQRSTMEALGMDPIDAQIRQVFFFDTPVVRARRVQRKGDDSVVKLRVAGRRTLRLPTMMSAP